MKPQLFIIFIIISLFIVSCGDDGNGDKKDPVIVKIEPTINEVLPDSVKAGEDIFIHGYDFGAVQDTSVATLNSDTLQIKSWSDSLITAICHEAATSGNIKVYVEDKITNEAFLKVYKEVIVIEEPDPPVIESLSKSEVVWNEDFQINGSYFGDVQGESYAEIGEFKLIIKSWSDLSITAACPQQSISGDVIVYVDTLKSNAKPLTVIDTTTVEEPAPVISELTPNELTVGENFEISGEYFGETQGESTVELDNVALAVVSWSDVLIVATAPAEAVTGDLIVRVGEKISNAKQLIVNEEVVGGPEIDYIDANMVMPEQPFGINGSNFGADQGDSYVTIGSEKLNIVSWSDTKIIAKCSEDAQTGDVVVHVGDKSSNAISLEVMGGANKAIETVLIPAGQFVMGANNDISGSYNSPAHTVTITYDFRMGKYEVTQDILDDIFMEIDYIKYKGDNKPIESIDWHLACKICNKLSELDQLDPCYVMSGDQVVSCDFDANGYRLPTEAEWEYACRAGSTGDFAGDISEMGWTNEDAENESTHDVGQKKPNAFGLYDMHGNVAEWCWDRFDPDYYSSGSQTDPRGSDDQSCPERVYRGGSFQNGNDYAKSAWRNGKNPASSNYDLGFRVVRKAK